jgi:glycosyltransferase involved in cell wall biosynthesis
MLFSVIVPTYNRAQLIGETIESILAQDYSSFELLIVDDGSNDDTEKVVKAYDDSCIQYFKKKNEERGAARNFALRRAKGQYALFFDSDDWMHPNHLSTLFKTIKESKETYNLIATKYQLKTSGGKLLSGGTDASESRWYTFDDLLKGNMFACHIAVNTQNPQLQYFEEDRQFAIMEDWMFLLSNLQHHSIFLVDEVTISFRHHDGRSMANNQKVIAARQKATTWILAHLSMTVQQQKILKAYSHYFCAIHFYLDKQAKAARKEIKASFKNDGPKKELAVLLLKTLVGRAWIERLKKV